jgi:hypothetical protein
MPSALLNLRGFYPAHFSVDDCSRNHQTHTQWNQYKIQGRSGGLLFEMAIELELHSVKVAILCPQTGQLQDQACEAVAVTVEVWKRQLRE